MFAPQFGQFSCRNFFMMRDVGFFFCLLLSLSFVRLFARRYEIQLAADIALGASILFIMLKMASVCIYFARSIIKIRKPFARSLFASLLRFGSIFSSIEVYSLSSRQ